MPTFINTQGQVVDAATGEVVGRAEGAPTQVEPRNSKLEQPTEGADKELAAKQFNSLEAMLRNARQNVLTQLGFEKNDYVMTTPNTGTQSDPFTIPSDPEAQKRMFNFLGSTIGKVQDPRATVYMRMPNGSIQSASPAQLRGLMQ